MQPLADRIRPQKLREFIGQKHLVGQDKPIHLAIKKDQIHSMIFWGPPGSGKTTLARIIASAIKAQFFHLSAVSAGKADVKQVIKSAQDIDPGVKRPGLWPSGKTPGSKLKRTVLFLDEIHRFNKAQQDYLLPFVETGTIILIGATTENPSFSVISPLLSRTQVFVLEEMNASDMAKIINRGAKELKVKLSQTAKDFLIRFANGDARQALNLLENTTTLYGSTQSRDRSRARRADPGINTITIENLNNALQSKHLRYDKLGEEHYNTISSYLKSMRASNVDAALYYLARMVAAGEDPLFIARRMVIFASEDVATPTALVVANAVFQACNTIGYPECQENLAAGTVYLCQAPKDRSAYDAYMKALEDVKRYGNLPIPLKIRNPVTKLMKDIGYGKGYEKYTKEDLLPEKLKGKRYYLPKKPDKT